MVCRSSLRQVLQRHGPERVGDRHDREMGRWRSAGRRSGAICRSPRSGSKAGASAHRTWCSSCRCPSRSRRAASSTISTSSSRRTSLKTAGFRRRKCVRPSGRSCITSSRSSASRNRSGFAASRPASSSRRRRSARMKRRKPARCPAIFWSATRRASRRRFSSPGRES